MLEMLLFEMEVLMALLMALLAFVGMVEEIILGLIGRTLTLTGSTLAGMMLAGMTLAGMTLADTVGCTLPFGA